MEVVDYSERSIAVIGDTKGIKEQLKELNGKYNPNLKIDGNNVKGWIFSKNREADVRKLITRAKTSKPSKGVDEYQEITYRVLKPYKGQVLYLYTYPDDDLKNVPESIEATVLSVSPNKTKMSISYQDSDRATCIIIDGQWGLQYATFPNYLDIE